MGNLEHNIKEAFAANDAKTKLADKNGMWNRLDNQMGRRKGVAAFWRVAAILLGVVLLTGAFATIAYKTKQQAKVDKVEMANASLLATIDSLISLPTTTKTKIQIVEKEKIVYRDRPLIQQKSNSEKIWEKKYQNLSDSTKPILASREKFYAAEIKRLEDELSETRQELSAIKQSSFSDSKSKQTAPFELKSERVEVDIQKKPSVKIPDVKMKVFQKNFIENRNNLNSTIFKK